MDKTDFANSLLCDKVITQILELPFLSGKHGVLRVIKNHDNQTDLLLSDFYPSIMERNGGAMPPEEVQERKTNLTQFGTSFYLDNDISLQTIQSVPSLREGMKAIAYGVITSKYGLIGIPDETGHLVLYLRNPLKNDLPINFKYKEV